MIITLAAVAVAGNVSQSGTLNILGQFDTIFASQFPAADPQIALVIKMLAEEM